MKYIMMKTKTAVNLNCWYVYTTYIHTMYVCIHMYTYVRMFVNVHSYIHVCIHMLIAYMGIFDSLNYKLTNLIFI